MDARTLISDAYCPQEISADLESEVTVLDRTQKTCASCSSIEEIVEPTKLAKSTVRGHIYDPLYDGPTSMERLQAHHDRMDKLTRVNTRLPEQIMLDAALAAERLAASENGVYPVTRRAKIVVCYASANR